MQNEKQIVSKNLPYIFAFALIAITFYFFNLAYTDMQSFKSLATRAHNSSNAFDNLARQINNAAVSKPDLSLANHIDGLQMFYTSKEKVQQQMAMLSSTGYDDDSKSIIRQLDSVIEIELPWIMTSNVIDSIIHNKSSGHIISLRFIDSLITTGANSTRLVLGATIQMLDTSILRLRVWMVAFMVIAVLLLLYTSYSIHKQRKNLIKNERELFQTNDLLIATNEDLRILSGHLQNIREDERKHIAREIHDELGQQLTAIKMDISWLNRKLALADGEHKEKMDSIFELIDNTINTVRKIASELRPPILDDLGLVEAIRWQINEFIKHTGIPVHFETEIEEQIFSPDITIGVFRIFQESLTNIAKHAHASLVECVLQKSGHHLLLTITDNGRGFILDKQVPGKSFGLLGMKERINMLKGSYKISSKLKIGTALSIHIPL